MYICARCFFYLRVVKSMAFYYLCVGYVGVFYDESELKTLG
ncbi:hypothetical protein MNB_SM-4-706 [hydrothermal vent metagenome]|uniref:Uncharacterized protein n=1 Tax=hydrothermal vent metagenome TaxID=652676 RepID=A0A1W1CVQ6_9ZZZZ